MKEITEEPESKWRPETISLIQRKIAREAKAFHNALGNALNDALQLFEVNRRASIPLCLNHFRHASAKALVNYSDAVRSVILSTLEKASVLMTSQGQIAVMAMVQPHFDPHPKIYEQRFKLFEEAFDRHSKRYGVTVKLEDYRSDVIKALYLADGANFARQFQQLLADDLETLAQRDSSALQPICKPMLSTMAEFRAEISAGESKNLEFKSTLRFDIKKAAANPDIPPAQCDSEDVMHSALKTIAALLNCRGGVLYVGVDDAGDICGLDQDFNFSGTRNIDLWEQFLRGRVDSRFKDGKSVGNHLHVQTICEGARTVARIVVDPRPGLSYLKRAAQTKFEVYVRQGVRSVVLDTTEIADFVLHQQNTRR